MLIDTETKALRSGKSVEAMYKRAQRGDILAVVTDGRVRWLAYDDDELEQLVGAVLRRALMIGKFDSVLDDLRRLGVMGYERRIAQ